MTINVHFAVHDLILTITPDGYIFTTITDVPCHLYCRITKEEPRIHKKPTLRRGTWLSDDVRFCFTVYHDNEQEEAGDTLTHTFIKEAWPICETRWFYFHGTIAGVPSVSTTAIFDKHFKGVDMYVISLAKLGEADLLDGHVKLKEGAGITLTLDAPNNAIEIAAAAAGTFVALTDTPAAYAGKRYNTPVVNAGEDALEFQDLRGFMSDWYMTDPSNQMKDSIAWLFDEVHFAITGNLIDSRLFTRAMRSCGFRRPFSCTIKLARGPQGAGNPIVWAAVILTDTDIKNNMTQQCVGWKTDAIGQVSCFNGDGVASTITNFAWGNEPPIWLRWIISAVDIKFYANETLVATHNTNLPTANKNAFFCIQAVGSCAAARTVYMSRPLFQSK